MDFISQNLIILIWLTVLAYFSWRKTVHGIYLVILFLPVYLFRTEIFNIPTTALELGIYILFLVWAMKNRETIATNKRKEEIVNLINENKILFYGIAMLLAGATISTIFSSELRTSAGILKAWFFDPFLFFIILVLNINNAEQKRNALKALFYSGATVAIISLIYYAFPQLDGVTYDGRLSGFYLSPNYLAMYLSPALIIGVFFLLNEIQKTETDHEKLSFDNRIFRAMHLFIRTERYSDTYKNRYIKYYWLVLIFCIAAAIFFTFSYSAWFGIITAFFLAGLAAFKKLSIRRGIFPVIFFLSCIAILLASQLSSSKFENLANLAYRSSFNSRIMIWRSAIEIGKDNPIVGIGPGSFQEYYLDYQARFTEPYLEWAVPQPHNIFLAFWLQTGIVGLAGFIIILAWFFRKIFNIFNLNKENYLHAVVLLSLMIYFLLHGLFDTIYWKNDLSMIFWVILALIASVRK